MPDVAIGGLQFMHSLICEAYRNRAISAHQCVRDLFNLGFRGPALTGLRWRISL